MSKREIYFYECQHIFHLKRWYIWLSWAFVDALFIFGCVKQIVFHESWGNNPMPDAGLVGVNALMLILSMFFIFMRLETVIDGNGCSVRYFPLLWKFRTIDWGSVEKMYVRKYSPVSEYGGWGMKSGRLREPFDASRTYTIYGNMGIQLELKNGKKVLVGTQRPQEVEEILRNIIKSKEVDY